MDWNPQDSRSKMEIRKDPEEKDDQETHKENICRRQGRGENFSGCLMLPQEIKEKF